MLKNIYILYGGVSVEHEVSLMSAMSIVNSLDRSKYEAYPIYITNTGSWVPIGKITRKINSVDELRGETKLSPTESIGVFLSRHYIHGGDNLFIPALHGTNGEDGTIQGMLEIMNVPYVGNGVLSSAACMDKVFTNMVLESFGISQAKFVGVLQRDYLIDSESILKKSEERLGYPVFVKPANAGSSVGVSSAKSIHELKDSIENAFKYDDKILIEEAVIGRELEVAVMGNDFPIATPPGEHVVTRELFDYEAKYFDKTTVLKVPTEVTEEQEDRVRQLAVEAYKCMGCSGLARVDIFMRDSDKKMLVNEINTMPGMTGTSLFPRLWVVTDGTEFPQLLDKLIELALDKYKEKSQLTRVK